LLRLANEMHGDAGAIIVVDQGERYSVQLVIELQYLERLTTGSQFKSGQSNGRAESSDDCVPVERSAKTNLAEWATVGR